jgi:hypothetical protein
MSAFTRTSSSLALILGVCAVLPSAAAGRAADADRPMGGTCDTTFVFTGPGPLHIEGTCQFLHLGLTTVVAEQIVIPTGPTTVNIMNTAVYTAANGDELHSSFVGTGTIDQSGGVTFSGTETFSGGTGRFDGASGSMTDVGTASLVTGTGQLTGDGSIVY